jgi:hypothetical protein
MKLIAFSILLLLVSTTTVPAAVNARIIGRPEAVTNVGAMIYFTEPSGASEWVVTLQKLESGSWRDKASRSQNSDYFDRWDFYDVTATPPNGFGLGTFRLVAKAKRNNAWTTTRACGSVIDWRGPAVGYKRSATRDCRVV